MSEKNFFDKFGNIKPNSWQDQSENPSTFNAAYILSKAEKGNLLDLPLILKLTDGKYHESGDYRTMEQDDNPDFSLDEKIAIMAVCSFVGYNLGLSRVRWFYKHFSHLRPDVIAATIYFKTPWLRFLVYPILAIKCIISCKEFVKKPAAESSGAQLAFILTVGGDMRLLHDLCEKIVGGWRRVFDVYYPEPDHPIRVLWRDHEEK